MLILGINTSENGYLSVSVSNKDEIIGSIDKNTKKTEETINLIYELFNNLSLKPEQLSAVGIITGPGGYTGIRAGVSVAKTIAQLLDIPVIGFNKADAYILAFNSDKLVCPLIDVKRNEVYTCIGKANNNNIEYVLEPSVIQVNDIIGKVKNSDKEITVLVSEFSTQKELFENINNVDFEFKINSDDICKITYKAILEGKNTKYNDILPIYAREAI